MNDSREADLPITVEPTGTLIYRQENCIDGSKLFKENHTNIENVASFDLLDLDFEDLPIDLSKQTFEANPTDLMLTRNVGLAEVDLTKINCSEISSTKPFNYYGNDLNGNMLELEKEGNKLCKIGRKQKSTDVSEASSSKIIKLDNGPPVVFMPKMNSEFNPLSCNHTVTSSEISGPNQNEIIDVDALFQTIDKELGLINHTFDQLLDMFPDIDRDYLRSLCNQGHDINNLSNIILEMNGNHPKSKNPISQPLLGTDSLLNSSSEGGSSASSTSDYHDAFETDAVLDLAGQEQEKNISECRANESQPMKSIMTEIKESSFPVEMDPKNHIESQSRPNAINNHNEAVNLVLDLNLNYQRQFDFLIGVLPDADPVFLKEKSMLDEREIEAFISESTEKQNYPKIQLKKEVKVPENDEIELGLYTSAFSVEWFLKKVPDPFHYFTNKERLCRISSHALEFMKRRYRNQSVKLIAIKYRDMGYNLTKTCDFLDSSKPSRSTRRALNEINIPKERNLPFLQEACFIEHKAEIKNYIDTIEEAKKLAYLQAEERGELFFCSCCCGHVIFEDCEACNEGDLFCKSCIQRSAEIRIGDGEITFPCLQACGSEFSIKKLKDLLDAGMFSKLLKRIQLAEVQAADIEGLEMCPFCEFASIPPQETKIFTCLNPDCLIESCRICHKEQHIPQRCEEVEDNDQAKARKFIENEMTKALVRECYQCKRSFIKSDGCNKMTCTCGAKMCYICREPIKDYQHFNGPGGTASKKCPLYSTDQVLHVEAVKAVAEKALQTVTTENPDLKLKHDPTKVLPKQPTTSSVLPPGVNEVPEALVANLRQIHERLRHGHRVQPPNPLGIEFLQHVMPRNVFAGNRDVNNPLFDPPFLRPHQNL